MFLNKIPLSVFVGRTSNNAKQAISSISLNCNRSISTTIMVQIKVSIETIIFCLTLFLFFYLVLIDFLFCCFVKSIIEYF